MKFEKALQAVDPAVTLPYWDFTVDAQEILLNHRSQYSKFWFEGEVRGRRLELIVGLLGTSMHVRLQHIFDRRTCVHWR